MALTIVIGNRNDSSWSLRGWLALRMSGAAFDEILVPLGRPDTRERILLRGELPMDLRRQQPLVELSEATRQDIQRICEAWADCRRRFGQDGPFLFGHASLADAFYAPVAARFRSYAVELPDIARTYVETIYQWPAFRTWYDAALREQAGS